MCPVLYINVNSKNIAINQGQFYLKKQLHNEKEKAKKLIDV